jgi:lipoprotein-anchoring transpeptidase ErfK/SrfK
MNPPSLARRIIAVMVATAMLVLSGSMAWAAMHDFDERTYVPQGVTVAGTDLSGMTEAEARSAIEQAVSAPLTRPVTVKVDGKDYEFDASTAVAVDVEAMLEEAFSSRRAASFVERVRHDVVGTALPAQVEPVYSVDIEAVEGWIAGVAKKTNRPAVDSSLTVESSAKIEISKSKSGRKTSASEGAKLLAAALTAEKALAGESRDVKVPVKKIKPKITEDSFGKTIVVDLSERRIRLFDGDKLEISYPCAVGTPGYPTPTGVYEITLKRYLPTWVNPAPNGWGKDMPASIPPGPNNPLGTRALNLSASGIRFHGTNNIASVGTAASHGCMRMYRSNIEDFYERVEVGTPVHILP